MPCTLWKAMRIQSKSVPSSGNTLFSWCVRIIDVDHSLYIIGETDHAAFFYALDTPWVNDVEAKTRSSSTTCSPINKSYFTRKNGWKAKEVSREITESMTSIPYKHTSGNSALPLCRAYSAKSSLLLAGASQRTSTRGLGLRSR